MKKGQGLPITTIILVIIGLLVLVLMVAMVYGKTKDANQGINELDETCAPPNQVKPMGTSCEILYRNFENVGPGEVCCKGE